MRLRFWCIALAFLPQVALAQPNPEQNPTPAPAPTDPLPQPNPEQPAAPETIPSQPEQPAPIPVAPLPEAPHENQVEPEISIDYDKGFVLKTGDGQFEVRQNLKPQIRFEFFKAESSDETAARFSIPRVRYALEGFAYGKANAYKMEFDFGNKGNAGLKDVFLDHDFGPLRLRAGQWKRPFSRTEIVSDFNGEFVDRTIANEFAGAGRDIGVAVHNGYEKSPEGLEWVLGVFNGTGEKSTQTLKCSMATDPTTCTPTTPSNVPSDYHPAAVARIGWNYGGIKGYSESDVEGGPLRLAVGASYKFDFNNFAKDANGDRIFGHAAELDAILKVQGFALTGAVYLIKNGSNDADVAFFGQAGYMVLPKKMEVAGRFAQIPDVAAGDGEVLEALASTNVFFEGHNYKFILDGGVLHHTAGDGTTDTQIRSQWQMAF